MKARRCLSRAAHRPSGFGTTCEHYGSGSNTSGPYCQNVATWDLGQRVQMVGNTRPCRYSCDEHAPRLVPYSVRTSALAAQDGGK